MIPPTFSALVFVFAFHGSPSPSVRAYGLSQKVVQADGLYCEPVCFLLAFYGWDPGRGLLLGLRDISTVHHQDYYCRCQVSGLR